MNATSAQKFLVDYKLLIVIVGGIAALALIIRFFGKGLKEITGKIADPIAKAIIPIIGVGPKAQVAGNVILPNGNRLPIDGLQMKPGLEFDHQGVRYKFSRRINGDYAAIRI